MTVLTELFPPNKWYAAAHRIKQLKAEWPSFHWVHHQQSPEDPWGSMDPQVKASGFLLDAPTWAQVRSEGA